MISCVEIVPPSWHRPLQLPVALDNACQSLEEHHGIQDLGFQRSKPFGWRLMWKYMDAMD
jgi:hypothetical protein